MKWNIQKHKVGNGQQEIKVSLIIQEMEETWASDSESWSSSFKDKLKEIPKTNAYPAEYGYRTKAISHTSLEVWKMKTNSDFNYKMFTVTRE